MSSETARAHKKETNELVHDDRLPSDGGPGRSPEHRGSGSGSVRTRPFVLRHEVFREPRESFFVGPFPGESGPPVGYVVFADGSRLPYASNGHVIRRPRVQRRLDDTYYEAADAYLKIHVEL